MRRRRRRARAGGLHVRSQEVKLYKYLDFSCPSEVDFQRLEALIRSEGFWCARPETLNDPEEFAWTCDYCATAETGELLTEMLVRLKGRTREEAQDRATRAVASGTLATFAKPVIDEMIEKCRNEIGLICFGSSPDNSVLWRRYGGSGAGVCIEIDAPAELLDRQLFHVQYSTDKRIHIDQLIRAFLDLQHVRDVYTLALLSKPISWATEAEIRFISRKQEVYVRIDGSAITRLILGEALTPIVRERIEEIVIRLRSELQNHENVA